MLKILVRTLNDADDETVELPRVLQACETLQVGLLTRRIKPTDVTSKAGFSLRLSEVMAQKLGLVDGMLLGYMQQDKTLVLGPTVGVLMSRGRVRRLRAGISHFRIDALVRANRAVNCLLYFFTLDDLDWTTGRVNGTYYDYGLATWRTGDFPIFNVLYDRGGGFTVKQRPLVRQLREQIEQHPAIHQVNCVYHFDKWEQYQRLAGVPSMQAALPYTRKGTLQNLAHLLQEYDTLYVKGCLGSNGLEVMRVEKQPAGYSYCYVNQAKTEVGGVALTAKGLWQAIIAFLGSKRFIVQQGIRVLQHAGHNLDFRVLMQRDEFGVWRLTDAPVRVSLTGAISSTRSGSTVYQLRQACTELLGMSDEQVAELAGRLRSFGMQSVTALETAYGRFGELGIDVAIDNEHKLWFIEANSKPGKDTVLMAGDKQLAHLAFARPLLYCRHLAGFPPGLLNSPPRRPQRRDFRFSRRLLA